MKRHFAWHKTVNHPAYILDERSDNYIYLSITHAPYNKYGVKNILLSMTDSDDRLLYIIPAVCIASKKEFLTKPYTKLKFSKKDGHIIRDIDKIVKQKYNK